MLSKFVVIAITATIASARLGPGDTQPKSHSFEPGAATQANLSGDLPNTVPPTIRPTFSQKAEPTVSDAVLTVTGCAPYLVGPDTDDNEFVLMRRDGLKGDDGSLVLLEPTVVTDSAGVPQTLYNSLTYTSFTVTETVYLSSGATPGTQSVSVAGATATRYTTSTTEHYVTASHTHADYSTTTGSATTTFTVTTSITGALTQTFSVTDSHSWTPNSASATSPTAGQPGSSFTTGGSSSSSTGIASSATASTTGTTDTLTTVPTTGTLSTSTTTPIPTESSPSATTSTSTTEITSPNTSGMPTTIITETSSIPSVSGSATATEPTSESYTASSSAGPSSTVPAGSDGNRVARAGGAVLAGFGALFVLLA